MPCLLHTGLDGGIINVMDSDLVSVSIVASIMRYVVQKKLTQCWMGQTPRSEGFVGRNAVSARISVTVKKVWDIPVDTFAQFWERKCDDRYSVILIWK